MHILRGLRREQAPQCMPELRRRLRPAADPACNGMAARTIGRKAPAIGQARASVFWSRRYRCAFGADSEYSAGKAVKPRVVPANAGPIRCVISFGNVVDTFYY